MSRIPLRVLEDTLQRVCSRKFPYESKGKKKRNWSAYNQARIGEFADQLRSIKEYVDKVEVKVFKNRAGRMNEISCHDKAKAVLLAELFQADERTASGLVELFRLNVGIEVLSMSPRTIGRAYYDNDVQYILEQIIKESNKPIQGTTTSFSADSTGMKLTTKSNWERDKEDEKRKKDFDMLSIMSDNKHHVIASYDLNEGPINDCPTLKPLFNETKELHPCMQTTQLDAGFLSRENTQHIANNRVTPYIFPKKNVTLKARGSFAWNNMLYKCVTDTQNWLREYHERSNIETVNYCLNTRFPRPLRRKQLKGRYGEVSARIFLHNETQLNTSHHQYRTPLMQAN